MWDPTPVGALSHGSGLDGNDPLPRRASTVIIIEMENLVLCSGRSLSHGGEVIDTKRVPCCRPHWPGPTTGSVSTFFWREIATLVGPMFTSKKYIADQEQH